MTVEEATAADIQHGLTKTVVGKAIPIMLLALLCVATMFGETRQVQFYRYQIDASYDALINPNASANESDTSVLEATETKSSETSTEINFADFLNLNAPSTREARAWLNQSFVEGNGFTKFEHKTDSTERNTVTYRSCCGLGHRLTRLEDAAHVALLYDASLRVEWNDCGAGTFQKIFGPEPLLLGQAETIEHDDPVSYRWMFGNDVPGCYKITQLYPEESSLCQSIVQGKMISSPKLYQELLDRYSRRDTVENFVKEHFQGKLAIGMHVRAGNNETGDFTRKNRQIADMNAFVKLNSDRVRGMLIQNKPSVLFIASDTPSYIEAFRKELNDTMPVVELEQPRIDGAGVFFGEHGAPKPKGEECIKGWHAAIQDMMLLASTDIVFAPAYSSFTRTMPKVLALSRPDRIVEDSFCEVWKRGNQGMVCYHSLEDFNANPPPMKRRHRRELRFVSENYPYSE